MEPGLVLEKDTYEGKPYQASPAEIKRYQSLVGFFFWLACMTRQDISYSVGKYSCYVSNLTPLHDTALKRIVRYLKETKKLGLQYGSLRDHGDRSIIGFTDSLHGDCLDTRQSTSGYNFFLYNGLVSWASKREATVVTSTAEQSIWANVTPQKNQYFWQVV